MPTREKSDSIHPRKLRWLFVNLLVRLNGFFERFFKKSSSVIGSLILMLLNSDELEQQVKQYYSASVGLEDESRAALLKEGLSQEESYVVATYVKGKKTCLVLGSGGGRESFALAQLGFQVTGIDTSPALVEQARERTRVLSLNCDFHVGDMWEGPSTSEKYDALFLSRYMYSAIPRCRRRIQFLRNARRFLKETGVFYLDFLGENGPRHRGWKFRLKKWLALLWHGNRNLEEGDVLWVPGHYYHLFTKQELLHEMEASGFSVAEADFAGTYVVLTSTTLRHPTTPLKQSC